MSIDDIAIPMVGVLLVIGWLGFCGYYIWAENTAESIVVHDGSQSYACEVSRTDQTPHQCRPIKDAK